MEEALIGMLLADAGLQALVANRIRWVQRPQGEGLPSVVLTMVDAPGSYTMAGQVRLTAARVQVDCWGKTFGDAKRTARAVKRALGGFRGEHDGVRFDGIFVLDEDDGLDDSGEDNLTDRVNRSRIDFQVWHNGE